MQTHAAWSMRVCINALTLHARPSARMDPHCSQHVYAPAHAYPRIALTTLLGTSSPPSRYRALSASAWTSHIKSAPCSPKKMIRCMPQGTFRHALRPAIAAGSICRSRLRPWIWLSWHVPSSCMQFWSVPDSNWFKPKKTIKCLFSTDNYIIFNMFESTY